MMTNLVVDVEDNEDSATNDGQWDDDGVLGFDDEIELNGPFEINLLENQVTFLDIELPTGQFEELEFIVIKMISNKDKDL